MCWMLDAYTTSSILSLLAALPCSGATASTTCGTASRSSIDAYDGTTTFYVFDTDDPIIAAYRGIFPTLFRDASAMPADLRQHVRYPETAAPAAGGGLRPVPHDQAGRVLQPRGSVDRRHRRSARTPSASRPRR